MMKRIVLCDRTPIAPFGEPARDLRIMNKQLWRLQQDLLGRHCRGVREIDSIDEAVDERGELLVYKDNLFFNQELIDTFISEARASGGPRQIAFSLKDPAITRHATILADGIRKSADGNSFVADMFYFPDGIVDNPEPLLVDTLPFPMGYSSVPYYMAGNRRGDLTFEVPVRAFLSIENWVHVFLANSPFGVFARGRVLEFMLDHGKLKNWRSWITNLHGEDWQALRYKIGVSVTTIWERLFGESWRNHFYASSKLVTVGKNCSIDPTAIIHGPTTIGDNVYVGPGAVITNSIIGNNVNVMQGCQVMLSVVSDRCYLPFNAALFMTTLMDNSMVAQNSTLQLCVVGRNTFIGANNVFTDFDLLGNDIQTMHKGKLEKVGLPVLGSAVGHNVKIGSGFLVYPGRMIESNVIMIHADPERVVAHNVVGAYDDPEEPGVPDPVVYKWPHEYDPSTRQITRYGESDQHSAFGERLQFQAYSEHSSQLTRRTQR